MKSVKHNSYTAFYRFSVILWVVFLVLYFSLKAFEEQVDPENFINTLISPVIHPLALFGIFGIPIIVIFSLPIRLAEYFINKIEPKRKNNE
tara:strand:+ start:56 stop:328 length:273 start_codon:yes stop_codon:yes gene_type:complete